MIETYLLQQLIAFSKNGTLSAASENLHISQPALSQSMKKLEDILGVPIFERTKNKLTLNDTGRLTVELTEKLLTQQEEMIEKIRLFDKTKHTLCLGACAPIPVSDIVPLLPRFYSGFTVSYELKNSNEALWEGLEHGLYQIIIVHEETGKSLKCPDEFFSFPYRQENLSLWVPHEHPLSKFSELKLKDLAHQNILLYTHIGFWYEICKEKLPDAHFLYMNEFDAFQQISGTSAFPSFTTDASAEQRQEAGKKVIPITDNEVHVTYHFVCRREDSDRFRPLIKQLRSDFSA